MPTNIVFTSGRELRFTYDVAGIKLRKEVLMNNAPISEKTTDYVGGFIYEGEELQFFSHPEGRIVNENGIFVYEYHYKDHLGNLRMSIKEGKTNTYTATLENTSEETQFNFIKTPIKNAEQKKEGLYSAKTTTSNPMAMWKSLPITKGDKVNVEVFAHYVENSTSNRTFLCLVPKVVPTLSAVTTFFILRRSKRFLCYFVIFA